MAISLHESIRKFRKQAGLSQEKVAEIIGVTRQAVTKWESGKASPSTENLIKLSEIFGVSLDSLIGVPEGSSCTPLSSHRYDHRIWKRNIAIGLGFAAAYLIIFLLSRIIYADWQNSSFFGALFSTDTPGNYLLGWLLHQNIFWFAAGISSFPAFLGKTRFSLITLCAFILGQFIGEIFGEYPPGIPYGHGHYGWAIWCTLFLSSIIVGIVMEILKKRNAKKA